MKRVSECCMLTIAFAGLAQPAALADIYLNCSTKKVIITSGPNGNASSMTEEGLSFWIDDAAKTFRFRDRAPLNVQRLDRNWITADRDDIFYEFNRQDGSLSYASVTTQADGITTTIVGSGRCEIAPSPVR